VPSNSIIAPPDPPGPGFPPIEDAAEFLKKELITPPELIHGILHQGCKMALGGASKTCKTWVLLDLALAVSQGVPWLGFPTTRGRVLVVNLELADWHIQKRLAAIAAAKGITITPGTLEIWNLRGRADDFRALLPHLQARLGPDHGYTLLILDPIYKLLGDADENKAGDIAKLLNSIDSVAVQSGAAIAFAAHFTKGRQGQKQAMDRISGSGVFARDPDSILTLTAHEVEDAYVLEATLRNFPPTPPFPLLWRHPLMEPNSDLDPALLRDGPRGRALTFTQEMVLEAFRNGPMTRKELFAKVNSATRMSERTFADRLKSLKDNDLICDAPGGRLMKRGLLQ
jgi:hypothetical protein